MSRIKKSLHLLVFLVIALLINLPLVSAIEISNVRTSNIQATQSTIEWETDQVADSFVHYGEDKDNLILVGDNTPIIEHKIPLADLTPETKYFYKVESSGEVDDNEEKLYSFTTPEPDTIPPDLNVELPETIAGKILKIEGSTEPDTVVNVHVNAVLSGTITSREDGTFKILGISLQENQENDVIVSATDASGNVASVEGKILTDTNAPVIELIELPDVVTEKSVEIKGTISEESSYQIFLENRSVGRGDGITINEKVRLDDGKNKLHITAIDKSGLDSTKKFEIFADTQEQFIKSEIERGEEYYEGRARSSISGETKPFSKVYLYIFRPLGYDYKPDFSKAREVVTADNEGNFVFEDVNFAKSILDIDIEDLAPKIVPSGLEDESVFSREQLEQQQRFSYKIYLITEDSLDRTAFSQHNVFVNTCLSGNLDFGIQSISEFQRPLILNPKLLDDGRQEIQAVFDLTYQGIGVGGNAATSAVSGYGQNSAYNAGYYPGSYGAGGSSGYTPSSTYTSGQNLIDIEQGFRITSVPRFDKACTQDMLKGDDRIALGCKIFPRSPTSVTKSNDGTKFYVTWKLQSAGELSKKKEDFWNEFKKRQIVLPLKIIVNYQEREGHNKWSASKVQTSCYDLGYSVDIPIDSADLIPDFLANEGVDALNWSITQLNEITPIVEQVYKITAIVSIVSLGLLTVARIYRVATSKIEPVLSIAEALTRLFGSSDDDENKDKSEQKLPEEEKEKVCPFLPDQGKLYLRSTIEDWCKLISSEGGNPKYSDNIPTNVLAACEAGGVNSETAKSITLEERCPNTAGAWKLEAGLNVAFQWSWDRAFCRSVPAGWTDKKSLTNIGTAIAKQQQCAVTGRGIPLIEVENCQEKLRTQVVNTNIIQVGSVKNVGTCWQGPDGTLYHYDDPSGKGGSQTLCPTDYFEKPDGGCCLDENNDGICDETKTSSTGKPLNVPGKLKVDFNQFESDENHGIYRLTPVRTILGKPVDVSKVGHLIAYKPPGSDQYIVGKDQTCEQVCNNPRRTQRFVADKEKGVKEKSVTGKLVSNGCYDEQVSGSKITLLGANKYVLGAETEVPTDDDDGELARGNRFAAGYTRDCFIKGYGGKGDVDIDINSVTGKPTFQQCVCKGIEKESKSVPKNDPRNPRVAVKRVISENVDVAESFSYRQDRIFKELKGLYGTHYPTERYYSGRDVSGAFGANYLLDYFNSGKEIIPRVDPHNQLIGTCQTVCLSGIYKNLKIIESVLVGMRNCLVEAKHTGLQDAGMCKTLFTQHVCGLIYKGISYLQNQCSPLNFDDAESAGDFGSVTEIASKGLQSIPEALEISINDVKDNYGNAKLNEYFREGSQGVAQSMCMAAFGLEFPLLSDDFLTEAALAFPTKSWVILGPRFRELSTFNPAKQTAVFNYDIGGAIMPGCKIRNWRISLKCIGPEDQNLPGVDTSCGGRGCDCLNAQGFASGGGGNKEMLLKSGTNIPTAQLFSIPLESPIRVDSPYRYDHVKVELFLDSSEKGNEDKCFEEGYFQGNKGVFYEPLSDTSAVPETSCQASLTTGQYKCSALSSLFGFGGAYIDEPFLSCWNYQTDSWASCRSPNLFLVNRIGNSAGIGDRIKVGLHLNLDDKSKCLKRTISPPIPGLNQPNRIIPLVANSPGQLILSEILGTVTESMFTGVRAFAQLATPSSNSRCNVNFNRVASDPGAAESGNYKLKFIPVDSTKFKVQVQGINPVGFSSTGGEVSKGTQKEFSINEINGIVFDLGGHKISNVLGNLRNTQEFAIDSSKDFCEYRVGSQGSSGKLNQQQITVSYQLLELDEGGNCGTANRPVGSSVGRTSISVPIILQKDPVGASQQTGMAQSFSAGNYDQTILAANAILSLGGGDYDNALANYYYVASLIGQGQKRNDPNLFKNEINQMLKLFFKRQNEQYGIMQDFSSPSTVEFQKIIAYMCRNDLKYGPQYQDELISNEIWCQKYGKS
jgi:hypothetical protein